MSRVIAVTGSASGIGAATAALLRERGDRVIGVDLRDAEVCADLSMTAGRAAAVAEVAALATEGLDGLVTCAGLSQAGAAQVSVNYFGTVDLVLGLQPALARSSAPRVALVSSISSTQPSDAAIIDACLAGDEPAALAHAEDAVAARRAHEIYSSTKTALNRWLRTVAVADEFAGQTGPCAHCGKTVTVPSAGMAPPPQPPEPTPTPIDTGGRSAIAARLPCSTSIIATFALVWYMGFILLVAWGKPLLGTLLADGLSVGMLLGSLVILLSWAFTGAYVTWANRHYDTAVKALRKHGIGVGFYFSLCDWHHPDYPAFTEETPLAPNSPYSASKAGLIGLTRSAAVELTLARKLPSQWMAVPSEAALSRSMTMAMPWPPPMHMVMSP